MALKRPSSTWRVALGFFLVASLAGTTTPADAQVKASERSTITQVVNGTKITVDYARPQARGRDALFGGVVHWGEVWTPGANFATTLTVDKPIRLDGHDLEAGTYSLWLIPQPEEWTMVVSDEPRLFHTRHPAEDTYVAEYTLEPAEGQHAEVLTFDFPVVKPDHAVLRLRWGTTTIPFRIDVPSWEPFALDPEDRGIYLGTYQVTDVDENGDAESTVNRLGLWEADGHIQGVWYQPEDATDEVSSPAEMNGFRFQAVPLGLHRFLIGHYRDGVLTNTEETSLLFTLDSEGNVSGIELRTTGENGEEVTTARGTPIG